MKKLLLCFVILFMCSGCYNYTELNELGIVSALSISKKDKDYLVDMQIINILESGENGLTESPITVISGSGPTLMDAIRSMNLKSSKIFFSPDVEYVILDKSVIKDDLDDVVDFLARDTKLSLNFLVVTSLENSGKDILSSLSQFNISSANNLASIVSLSEERYGASYSLNFLEYLRVYLEKGVNHVYPNVVIKNDSKKSDNIDDLKESDADSYIEIDNLVTFNNKGEATILDKSEAFGYNFLKNHIKNATISVSCGKDKYFAIETLKSNFAFDGIKGNKLKIRGEITGEIVYYGCDGDVDDKSVLEEITDSFKSEVKSYVNDTVSLAKDTRNDFIGIGNYIYKNEHDYFDFDKEDWDSLGLVNLDYDISIKAHLSKQGNLKGDIK